MEYALELGASVHEGDPPWNQHVIAFPPPETARSDLPPASLDGPQIICSTERLESKGFTEDDANAAIEEYCGNDLPFGDPNLPLGGFELVVRKGTLNISASWHNGLEDQRGYIGPYSSDQRDFCR